MKRVEAIIRPIRLDSVKAALHQVGVGGLTVTDAAGLGTQKSISQTYRGTEVANRLLPRVKLEVVVSDGDVERVIDAIIGAAATGEAGDGKIFVSDVSDAVRIRTRQRGEDALN